MSPISHCAGWAVMRAIYARAINISLSPRAVVVRYPVHNYGARLTSDLSIWLVG